MPMSASPPSGALGVDGGQALIGSLTGLGRWPPRSRPGTPRSITRAINTPRTSSPRSGRRSGPPTRLRWPGLHPQHVVAVGESQSAIYLTMFADAVQPRTDTFDGIFLHSRFGFGAPLGSNLVSCVGSDTLRIRTDLKVPVFMAETQTDVTQFGYWGAQQGNTERIRTWEIAGTSHADGCELLGDVPASTLGCKSPINTGPQHNVVQAAFSAFDKWIVDGTPPPSLLTLPPGHHASAEIGARRPRQRGGRRPDTGRRRPGLDPRRRGTGRRTNGLPLFRVDRLLHPGPAGQPVRDQKPLHRRVHHELDKAIAGGYILGADRASLLTQAEQVQFPS